MNSLKRDAELIPYAFESSSIRSFLPDENNFFVSKFGRSASFSRIAASVGFVSALAKHILGVFLEGSNKKVIRIYAFPVVAFMKNQKSVWDSFSMKRIRESVGHNESSKQAEPAVTLAIDNRCPFPASIWIARLVHLVEESFGDTLSFAHVLVPSRQELAGAETGPLTRRPSLFYQIGAHYGW